MEPHGPGVVEGPLKAASTQGSFFLVLRSKRGIPEIMVCRILMFMWAFVPVRRRALSLFPRQTPRGAPNLKDQKNHQIGAIS